MEELLRRAIQSLVHSFVSEVWPIPVLLADFARSVLAVRIRIARITVSSIFEWARRRYRLIVWPDHLCRGFQPQL